MARQKYHGQPRGDGMNEGETPTRAMSSAGWWDRATVARVIARSGRVGSIKAKLLGLGKRGRWGEWREAERDRETGGVKGRGDRVHVAYDDNYDDGNDDDDDDDNNDTDDYYDHGDDNDNAEDEETIGYLGGSRQ